MGNYEKGNSLKQQQSNKLLFTQTFNKLSKKILSFQKHIIIFRNFSLFSGKNTNFLSRDFLYLLFVLFVVFLVF